MSAEGFYMALKSSLDRVGYDLVTDTGADGGASLDDTINVDEMLSSDDKLILWQLISVEEDPRDPLYRVTFGVGGKTAKDPANYALLDLQKAVATRLRVGKELLLYDYSGVSPSALKGSLTISQANLTPQEVDNDSGLRMFLLTGRAMRLV